MNTTTHVIAFENIISIRFRQESTQKICVCNTYEFKRIEIELTSTVSSQVRTRVNYFWKAKTLSIFCRSVKRFFCRFCLCTIISINILQIYETFPISGHWYRCVSDLKIVIQIFVHDIIKWHRPFQCMPKAWYALTRAWANSLVLSSWWNRSKFTYIAFTEGHGDIVEKLYG